MERRFAIPAGTPTSACNGCTTMVARVRPWGMRGGVVTVELDGTPHVALRCKGSKEYRKHVQMTERLAELHEMKRRGEAT